MWFGLLSVAFIFTWTYRELTRKLLLISKSLILLKSLALNRPLVNIEPFRTEIVPGVFLSGVPLGTNVIGFSFIDIRDANDQEISTCVNLSHNHFI
jgi:hypothetical protein